MNSLSEGYMQIFTMDALYLIGDLGTLERWMKLTHLIHAFLD
ncbi:hypothetical protein [Cytobacillus firmus]|nr:hypothetical protein [Cytobacillus firmus]